MNLFFWCELERNLRDAAAVLVFGVRRWLVTREVHTVSTRILHESDGRELVLRPAPVHVEPQLVPDDPASQVATEIAEVHDRVTLRDALLAEVVVDVVGCQ